LVAGWKLIPFDPAGFAPLLTPLISFRSEVLYIAYLDNCGRLTGDELHSSGRLCGLRADYRSLFARAFELQARGLILAHNHPSGLASPSPQDEISTRQLHALAKPMGIELVDHLILGGRSVFSMRSAGLLG
jgi:DNA repair protein RadC